MNLTCTSAIYEKGVNFYEVDFVNTTGTPSCILLNNSSQAKKGSKVSHAVKDVKECISYVNSQNNEESKIDQIFDQNNGYWNVANIIQHSHHYAPSGDIKRDKIQKHLRAKYDEAIRKRQIPIAAVAANEVNYEFDINVSLKDIQQNTL
uniref:Uncharacterized protein n=1 Tax=Meloidogyne enterolobii TaxID=390850 RepID=A0A6V7XKX9_MELEN|nr:unnamed protein product [Meloidogyne enterolobii]